MSWFREMAWKIRNVFYWLPVIWNDRSWDYCDVLIILRHKLNQMERSARNEWQSDYHFGFADQLLSCIDILNRLIADQYLEEAFAEHDRKWGEIKMSVVDGSLS